MMMSRFSTTATLLALLVACSKAPDAVDTAQPSVATESSEDVSVDDNSQGGTPVTIHARIQYSTDTSASELSYSRQLDTAFYIETDAIRYDEGGTVSYTMADGSRVQGTLKAQGNAHIVSSDGSMDEVYQMHGDWPELITPTQGMFRIKQVSPSHIGQGMEITLELEVPVKGSKKTVLQSKDATSENSETQFATPVECSKVNENEDLCNITFTIDAVPTEAQDAIGEQLFSNAKELYSRQGKIAPDQSMIIYSSLVPVYGATTTQQGEHFVTELDQSYQVTNNGTQMAQHLKVVAWSTARGDLNEPAAAKAMTN